MLRIALVALVLASCAGSSNDEFGEDGKLSPLPPPGKEDGQYHNGLAVDTDSSLTDVWTVTRQWEDRDSEAGMAWSANSGLNWDEKFSRWIASLEWTASLDGWSMTVKLTTPWGKTLPSPMLECAETALFLRIAFASWYGLPLQFEAIDEGQRVYFGHFGVRTALGVFSGMPDFATRYADYSGSDDWKSKWPSDSKLRTRLLHGGEDNQTELAPGAVFGAYLDEIHLNKRVGYFTVIALDYLGSMNLADSANTYNLEPEAIRPGDFLIERWQKEGIGHTLVVKDVTPINESSFDVTLISGSMPRRQGVRASGSSAKSYFTGAYTGGPGMDSAGDSYASLGGGLKRYRVAKKLNGYWTNTWMSGDEAHWINSLDYDRIAARPARFETLLGEVPLDQRRTEILARIDDARHHLSQYPASCSAREQREQAFRDLYDVEGRLSQKSQSQVDAEQRKLEDYVFAQLEYSKSKTCCWDSSSAAMYDIIVKAAEADKAAADANQVCVEPTVFAARADDYQHWIDYAASIGESAAWKPYTDDEGCVAHAITTDTVAAPDATPYCSLTP